LKKKKNFLFEFSFWAESLVRPSRPPRARVTYAAQLADTAAQLFTGAQRVAEPNPTRYAKSDPMGD
jgi:hypothetical protein